METMHIEKKTTRWYIIGVWKIYWTHCILEFAQIPSKITVGCFTGIESDPPLHVTIKGFPWKWSRGNHIKFREDWDVQLKLTQMIYRSLDWLFFATLTTRQILWAARWADCFWECGWMVENMCYLLHLRRVINPRGGGKWPPLQEYPRKL